MDFLRPSRQWAPLNRHGGFQVLQLCRDSSLTRMDTFDAIAHDLQNSKQGDLFGKNRQNGSRGHEFQTGLPFLNQRSI